MSNVQKAVLQSLKDCGAFIDDSHIVHTAGYHAPGYVDKDALFTRPALANVVAVAMARQISEQYDQNPRLNVVVGPVAGGAILSQLVGFALCGRGMSVLSAFAYRDGEGFVFRPGYGRLCAGQNVMVVEDVLTTGGSVRKVVDAVRAVGGNVVGVAAIINRGNLTPELLGVDWFRALVNIKQESWSADECPLCRTGVPINTTVGKGCEFLAAQSR